MRLRSRTTLATAGAVFALAAGGGGALAAGGLGGGSGPGGPPGSTAIASYLGLTQAELRTQLESGKTLAQIAAAQGKSVTGLEDVMYADAKTHLDQAVADGKLTAAQEQTMLANLKSHLDDIVNHTGPPLGAHGPGGPPFGAAVASYLGLTQAELRTQLEGGKTLAQIAAAQGKSVPGLKAAILAEAKSHLDQAVADGKLTADQAKTMLAELTSHLDDLVNRTGPPAQL
jgi:polyhydroxyalkanoate synthesis regulator phasin